MGTRLVDDTCTWRTPAPDAGAGECRCGWLYAYHRCTDYLHSSHNISITGGRRAIRSFVGKPDLHWLDGSRQFHDQF